jgi:hypothetical protein
VYKAPPFNETPPPPQYNVIPPPVPSVSPIYIQPQPVTYPAVVRAVAGISVAAPPPAVRRVASNATAQQALRFNRFLLPDF